MKAGLLGRKLGHSLSPEIHRLFGDYDYRLYEREPDQVADFVRSCELDFFNVTIPYKQEVYRLCDSLSPLAKRLGNVNFVMRRADGSLYGDNTDAFGVARLLDVAGADICGRRCAILGAGGAAMTVRAVLEDRGAAEVVFVRRGELPPKDVYLIVNATPVGMFPDVDGVRIDVADYPSCPYVLDLVYNPSPTRLVREAWRCRKTAMDGMVMLIAQAYRAFVLAAPSPSAVSRRQTRASGCETLFLYGPPASGKSTLGRNLAFATRRRLTDLDAEIVRREGRPIPEIFASEGEVGFRAKELAALKAVTARPGGVVALGGGALLNPEARRLAERAGRIVCLDCPIDALIARLTGGSRPLAADRDRLMKLMEERRDHYASFPVHVNLSR